MKAVLFVCVHNSGRSQMAEAFLNRLAAGRAKALSAGTQPAENVDPAVVQAMREVGIDISDSKPKILAPRMLEHTERVVTMGCGLEEVCPTTLTETEDWGLEDPKGKPLDEIREIRDEIQARVEALVTQWAR
jgi:protein-tyrosine-phosphatase